MKTAFGLVLVVALALSVAPAVAGDTFQTLRSLPPMERANLTPLSDDQLAAVEGSAFFDLNISVNAAVVPQINVCALCNGTTQTNVGVVFQRFR